MATSLPQMLSRYKSNVLPFVSQPALARRVRGLMMSFVAGRISRATLNEHLAEILPPDEWIECGLFSVRFDGHTPPNREGREYPVVTFRGEYSLSGTCPVCLCDQPGRYLAGAGLQVDLWCMRCGAVYSSPMQALRTKGCTADG